MKSKQNLIKTITAVYKIVIGIGMIGIWIILFFSKQIPELENEKIRITMHILAEISTGGLLVASGILFFLKKQIYKPLHYLSLGALLYTLIASPGYYGEKGEWGTFAVFIILLIVTVGVIFTNQAD